MKRLYRSRTDQFIGGVAAGMAEYFGIDPTLSRIIWVLIGLAGPGFLLYLVCWIIIPEAPAAASDPFAPSEPARPEPPNVDGAPPRSEAQPESQPAPGGAALGIILMAAGAWFLLDEFVPRWFDWDKLWPLILIGLGLYLLARPRRT